MLQYGSESLISAISNHLLSSYHIWHPGSSVSSVIRLRSGRPGSDSRQGQGFFLFVTASRPTLKSTQSPIQWIRESFPVEVNRP